MEHPIYRVTDFEISGPYTLTVLFDDNTQQVINFRPVLAGYYYGPLQDKDLFEQVEIDPEVHTLVWPNGADFDPLTLHDWPKYAKPFEEMALTWVQPVSENV